MHVFVQSFIGTSYADYGCIIREIVIILSLTDELMGPVQRLQFSKLSNILRANH